MLRWVEAGARRAGRSAADVEKGVLAITSVSSDRAQAHRLTRHQIAFYSGVAPYFEPIMAHHGFLEPYGRVREHFLAGRFAEAFDAVTEEMVEALTLTGSPDHVRRELARFDGVVDFVMIYSPSFLLGADEIRASHEAMIDAFTQ
jgi:alkanesulfonate monooxygenase SsuD/methylene tetrahydromethanopterin reductase-like flavin-dependent oxidoreductase (luciferase family)